MLNYVEFVLLIVLFFLLAILLFLSTGIIYNKEGYVSIIERKGKFFKIEEQKLTYAFPILYKKKFSYPKKIGTYKRNKEIIKIEVNDIMLLYNNKINLKKLIKKSENLNNDLAKYKIKIVK